MKPKHARPTLVDLRNKTDRQLMALAGKEVDCALSLAHQGALAEAENKCELARTLSRIARAPDSERAELEARLQRVDAALQRARSGPMTFRQAACG